MSTIVADKNDHISLKDQVASLRNKISELQLQRDQIENARLPVPDATKRICDWIDQQSNLFDTTILDMFSSPTDSEANLFNIESKVQLTNVEGQLVGMYANANIGPLMCYLFNKPLKETISSHISSLSSEVGPPTKERPSLIEKIDSQIHSLEIEEETLIVKAKSNGIQISRHPNFNPEIVLEFKE